MKNTRITGFFPLLTVSALLLLSGCNKAFDPVDAGSITVEAGIGAMTKVTTDGVVSSFEEGDKIAVYAWTGSAAAVPSERAVDGVVNTLGSDGKWAPASKMYWKPGSDAHYFLGVSPVRTISDFTADAFTLTADDAVNDLLFAKRLEGLTPGTTPVALTFEHAMARLTVNLKVRNEIGASPVVTVAVTAKSGATVNYLAQAVTATGDAAARSLTAAASAPTGYTHSFSGIQVPQEGVRTITITVAGQNYVFEAGEDIPLASGHHTTLGLILGKDKLELSGVSVSDWGDGDALAAGTAAATKINGHAFVDMGNGLLWATCNVGAENPSDVGDLFSWGEIVPKAEYSWGTYKWMEAGQASWMRITKYTFADGMNSGTWWYEGDTFKGDHRDGVEHKDYASYDYADDAARQNWGGPWRTPTDTEWAWLCNDSNCKWEWKTTADGYACDGMLVTSRIAGFEMSSLFLPAAGYRGDTNNIINASTCYYWSSSLNEYHSYYAKCTFLNSTLITLSNSGRSAGMPVRAVSD